MKTNRELLWMLAATLLIVVAAAHAQEEPTDELTQMVVDLLHEQDKEMRSLALEQVRTDCKGQAATKRFAAELTKLPPDGQVGLLSALGDRGDSAARTAVLEMLDTSDDPSVNIAAIGALGDLGETGDTQRLVQILAEGPDAEKDAARSSLVRLQGDDVAATIASEMGKAAVPVRIALIEVLTQRRAVDALPAILSAAIGDDASVRVAAMKSLSQIGSPEQLPGMLQGVLKADPGRERDAAEKCVMQVCGRIEDRDRRAAPVLAAIDQLDESDRLALLPTVGRVGGADALQAVEAVIAKKDPQQHEIGIRALCNWPDASIAPRLIELVNSDAHPAHRITALRALIRVAPLSDERTDEERLQLLGDAMEMCTRDDERKLILDRARTIRTLDALQFVLPYLDQPAYAEQACLSIVELAHHRGLREPNKAEFDAALDRVIAISKDATVVDRAQRYKLDQTWVRPEKPAVAIVAAKPDDPGAAGAPGEGARQPETSPAELEAAGEGVPPWTLAILGCVGIAIVLLIVIASRKRAGGTR